MKRVFEHVHAKKTRKISKQYTKTIKEEQLQYLEDVRLRQTSKYYNSRCFFLSCNIYRYVNPNVTQTSQSGHIFRCFHAKLSVAIGDFEANTIVQCIELNILNGRVTIYNTEGLVLCESFVKFNAEHLQIGKNMVIREVMQLLYRGHSIKHNKCKCIAHDMPGYRATDIGVFNNRTTQCMLGFVSNYGMHEEEINKELGTVCMREAVIDDMSVYEVLVQSGKFVVDDSSKIWNISKKHFIDNKEKLLAYIQAHPMGVDYMEPGCRYPAYRSDVETLCAENEIVHLKNVTNGRNTRLYQVKTSQRKCDVDIQKLWHTGEY